MVLMLAGKLHGHLLMQYKKRVTVIRSVDKFYQTLARVVSSKEFLLAKSENNSGSGEEESMRGVKNTCQVSEWVFVFTRQTLIPLAVGEWLSAPLL
jgi:hypothetical protein